MHPRDRKICVNAIICLTLIYVPTIATLTLPPKLAYNVAQAALPMAILAGIAAVVWPFWYDFRNPDSV